MNPQNLGPAAIVALATAGLVLSLIAVVIDKAIKKQRRKQLIRALDDAIRRERERRERQGH